MKELFQQETFLDPQDTEDRGEALKRRKLREAIEPYMPVSKLREMAEDRTKLEECLRTGELPEEVSWLLSLLATVLAPIEREQIKSPRDIATYLQIKMGHACQEQFCVVCLNGKNRIQKVHTVYQGNVNSALIRPGEVYQEPVKLNSSAVIFAHNHPSSDPTPSPQDVLVTRALVQAGKLLDIDPLDHLIISRDTWVSLRERGLGFDDS
jgi:DNA repair protein RadC